MHKIVEREDYFAAAIEILADADHGGLRMTPLCRHLNVTTGSFYNYFGSWAGFKTEFLAYWREGCTVHLAEAVRREANPRHARAALIEFACTLPHRAEAAIRAWAHSDEDVGHVQAIVDEERYRVAVDILCRTIEDRERAELVARLCQFILTGYQQTQPLPDVNQLRGSLNMVNGDTMTALRPAAAR
jgi:AcrR family transcriptional regulator